MRRLALVLLMATTLSRDTLTGGDAASLDGRTPDGGGVPAQATGTYEYDATEGTPGTDEIAIVSGVGVAYGPSGARYGLGGIPSLPAAYTTIAEFLFPDRASGTRCDGIAAGSTIATNGADWKNQGGTTDTGNPNLSTLVIDGSLAGTSLGAGTWTDSPENINDPLTLTDEGVTANISAAAYVDGMGLGPSAGIRLTAHITDKSLPVAGVPPFYNSLAFPSSTRFEAGFYANLTPNGYTVFLERDNSSEPDTVTWLFGVSSFGSGGPVEVTGLNIDEPIEIELRVFKLGSGLRSLLCGYLNGELVTSRLSGELSAVRMPFVKAFTLSFLDSVEVFSLTGTPGGLGSIAYATQEVMVKWDKTTSTGYVLRTEMFEESDLPTVDYYLEEWSAGVATGLRYTAQLPITYDTPQAASLEYIDGVLYARDTAGALIWDNGSGQSFDLAMDVADDTAATVANHTTGDPGFGAQDGTGFFLAITEHRVEGEGCVPGGGGGGGGGGSGETGRVQWVMDHGLFTKVRIPSAASPTQNQPWSRGAPNRVIEKKVQDRGLWTGLGFGSIFVLDPDDGNPDSPICPDPGGVIDPLPDPAPFTGKVLSLYNMTKNLLGDFPPFNTAGTGSNPTDLPALLAALAARSMKLILIPAWRREQTLGGLGRAPYDHTACMAKINSWTGFTDPNLSVIVMCMVFDDLNCDACWNGRRPTNAEVNEACAAVSSIFGVPAGVTTSPRILRSRGYDCAAVQIGGGAFGGRGFFGNSEGFGDDVDGWIAAQQDAATFLGLSAILPTINPYRNLDPNFDAWRTDVWTDAYLEEKGVILAGMGMGVGVNFWTGYPPSARLRTPGTNAAVSAIAAAL